MINVTTSRMMRVPPRSTEGRGGLVLVAAAAAAAAPVLTGAGPLILRFAAGLFLLIVLPVLLVNAKINWPRRTRLLESLLYSLALVVLGLMVGGLIINSALPLLGVARPLDRVPVVVTLLIALAGLGVWRPGRWRLYKGLSAESRTAASVGAGWRDQLALLCALILVVGSIVGPIRLNNGASGTVVTATLFLAAVVIVMVFSWRRILRESTIVVTIYLLSLSLLLMTSLRGWFVTGHDIQREFRVFELASDQGVWNVGSFREAYNACLSITILPTVIGRTTGIPDIYVFQTVFQLLYALCPVLIYLLARRFASRSVAILAAVYFVAFPTYFTDMPFLNRQEVAFFFMGVALLLITNQAVPIRTRKVGFVVFGIGVILSHYSTTYVLLGVLMLGWIVTGATTVVCKLIATSPGRHTRLRQRRACMQGGGPRVLTWTVILALTVLTFLWSGPITGTGGQVEQTFGSTLNSLMGGGGQRSSDASYSIFGGAKPSPERRMEDYRNAAVASTQQGRENGTNYPLSETDRYPTPVAASEKLPITAVGRIVEGVGINVSTINGLLRGGAPIMLQLFVGLGLLLALLGRARGFVPSREFLIGATGCMGVIALHVLLPDVSVDYGILRTFAQGLFWLAPFLAVGSIEAFSWLSRSTSMRVALGIATVYFLSLTGVIPQLLGGYPAQLHLNNSGQYYDNYYLHAQEVSAITWLQNRGTRHGATSVQTEVATDRFVITQINVSEISPTDDIFPMLLRKDAYAFLGYPNIRKGQVTFSIAGDLVTYKYPVEFLDKNKSLIYSSNGARIYR
jgi:uncharacterized membrane protein